MASEIPAPAPAARRETQEQSIKARKHELFAAEESPLGPSKPFGQYILETPPSPLLLTDKMMLGGVAALVLLLLVVALVSAFRPRPAPSVPEPSPASAPAKPGGK